ncbi:MAG: PilZ domain-containing protein [Candidatus Omnitrophica bacterium]|nr:PilZ domain-containing protein [Candidatus Omnitrophota bacterium]
MQVIEYRHFIRHPLCIPLSYKIIEKSQKKDREDIRSKTINVSLGGLLFPSKHPVDPKSKIVIKMPFENKIFNVRAQVVRCIQNSETKLYDIAVNFSKTQEAFKAKMVEQIYLIAGYRDMLRVQSGKEISMEEASRKWINLYSARFKRLYW